MSIISQIERIKLAKNDLLTAINAKGGMLTADLSISEYAGAVDAIKIDNGPDLSGVTVTADKLLAGVVAIDSTGAKITGNIPSVTLFLAENVVSISRGYTEGGSITVPLPEIPEYPEATVAVDKNTVIITAGIIGNQSLTIPESVITETPDLVTIGTGYIAQTKTFVPEKPLPAVSVAADKLLEDVTAINSDGEVVTGVIPTVAASKKDDIITVPRGYIAEEQIFDTGVILPAVSVTADKLLKDVTAINSDGEVVTGVIGNVSLKRSGNVVSIGQGYTEGGSVTVPGGSGSGDGLSKAQLFCATLMFK